MPCSNKSGHYFIGQFREKQCETRVKPSTITVSEAYANAGLFGESRTAHMTNAQRLRQENDGRQPEDFIERAETKITMWPFIGGTKAARAGIAIGAGGVAE